MDADQLQQIANKIRFETFRAIADAGAGHFGGSLSEIEILTALYFYIMHIDPANPGWESRDRFVLSKGHGGPGLYATLAERGYFEKALLKELDQDGSRLPKHVDRSKLPGIDTSSGALGQGLSVGVGMAISAKMDKKNIRVYAVLSDGEMDEGQTWEAAMTAVKYKLDNLTVVMDRNGLQVDGEVSAVMPVGDLAAKWKAFGWFVIQLDGHNMTELIDGFDKARSIELQPTILIAETTKGKGVSFMEGKAEWHAGKINEEQKKLGLEELQGV